VSSHLYPDFPNRRPGPITRMDPISKRALRLYHKLSEPKDQPAPRPVLVVPKRRAAGAA